jgi:hypothetical protein
MEYITYVLGLLNTQENYRLRIDFRFRKEGMFISDAMTMCPRPSHPRTLFLGGYVPYGCVP